MHFKINQTLLQFGVPNNFMNGVTGKTFFLFLSFVLFRNTYIWMSYLRKPLFQIVYRELMHVHL